MSERFDKLWGDEDFVLSRSVGSDPKLLLAPSSTSAVSTSVGRLEHFFGLRDLLDGKWAARPRELVDHERGRALLLDDPGGQVLASLVGNAWDVEPFLRVAISIAVALGRLHERGLIHKDLKPAHILWSDANDRAWLTGFGIASQLPRERVAPDPPASISGTLAYLAPEQTGRMNRSLDSRSDLYSLGIVLYQLLAGRLPFVASDPLEWIHCHIARLPPPLGTDVPAPLEAIVLKLLAKTAEDRYQTAAALEFDLRHCLASWQSGRSILEFSLASKATRERLLIPERLYGRQSQVDALSAAFDRVAADGTAELVLVSGSSGIGKSSVVNELHKTLVPPRGLLGVGKFDQYKRDIPYATIAQAFQGLIRQILGKRDEELRRWRDALQDSVGVNGRLIVNLIPELELVIGRQPDVARLLGKEEQIRFQTVFRRFLGVFARPEHPLALFLDDLQWLDAATLDLFEHLITEPEVRHLLLIGAYRDNEVGSSHPLMRRMESIRGKAPRLLDIQLEPLERADVAQLLSDSLHGASDRVSEVTALVHEKSGGNPFFAIQFLSMLADEGLLVFDAARATWTWDAGRIHAKGFTDNVVELMAGKLDRFPPMSQHALWQLACLGGASSETLSLVRNEPEDGVHSALREAVRAGFVVCCDDAYSFLHDRIQEAAYALFPVSERAREHLRIGRILLANNQHDLEPAVFDIVDHFNRSTDLLESRDERERVAELNLIAAKRARAATAFTSALSYLETGCALVTEDGPDALTFGLQILRAECEILTGSFDAAEQRLVTLSRRVTNPVDRAAIACLEITLNTTRGQLDRAIGVLLEYLDGCGIRWSPHPSDEDVEREYASMSGHLGVRTIEELVDAPLLVDSEQRAILEVLVAAAPPVMFTEPRLFRLIIGRMTAISLQYGNTDASCLAYVFLGMILVSHFDDASRAYRFGQLGFDLVEKRGLDRFKARVYICFGTLIIPWTRHLRSGQDMVRTAFQVAENNGDLEYASYRNLLVTNLLATATPLVEVQRAADHAQAYARKTGFGLVVRSTEGAVGLTRSLRGLTARLGSFDREGFDEARFEQELTSNPRLAFALFGYSVKKIQARYHGGDYVTAFAAAEQVRRLLWIAPSLFEVAEYHLYAALTRAQLHADDQPEHLAALRAHHQQFAVWARNCPENFASSTALVAAEIARIDGHDLEAMRLYEQSARIAHEHGFVQNEGLAHELAGRFHIARGFDTFGLACLRKARDCFERWGAVAKVQQLDHRYPALDDRPQRMSPTATLGPAVGHLDVATVMKISQAVSQEIVLDRLIEKLMVIAIEHAGATRGLLVLPWRGEYRIEAEATTTQSEIAVRTRRADISAAELPESVLRFVVRTRDSVLLDDAVLSADFAADDYIRNTRARSVFCLPLVKQSELIGVLYLENHMTPHVFTPARVDVLRLLASQAAISLENARLYAELRAADAEKESLLKEVHHRVKNNLQLVSSLLNLQASRAGARDVAELFADSRNRVRSMALVHENLYRAGDFAGVRMGEHIRTLCAWLVRAYADRARVDVVVEIGEVQLDVDRAVTCGLIVNELVSNALKHAFPHGAAGRIEVRLHRDDDDVHILQVADDGVGISPRIDVNNIGTLGLSLVGDLTRQLGGALTVSREAGSLFTLTFVAAPVGSGP